MPERPHLRRWLLRCRPSAPLATKWGTSPPAQDSRRRTASEPSSPLSGEAHRHPLAARLAVELPPRTGGVALGLPATRTTWSSRRPPLPWPRATRGAFDELAHRSPFGAPACCGGSQVPTILVSTSCHRRGPGPLPGPAPASALAPRLESPHRSRPGAIPALPGPRPLLHPRGVARRCHPPQGRGQWEEPVPRGAVPLRGPPGAAQAAMPSGSNLQKMGPHLDRVPAASCPHSLPGGPPSGLHEGWQGGRHPSDPTNHLHPPHRRPLHARNRQPPLATAGDAPRATVRRGGQTACPGRFRKIWGRSRPRPFPEGSWPWPRLALGSRALAPRLSGHPRGPAPLPSRRAPRSRKALRSRRRPSPSRCCLCQDPPGRPNWKRSPRQGSC
mmetsp:Transcript_5634/g.16576  ORF Transcript_5634/g.16576 Transcript_5634/m.16576 type:complete len:386 (+) Transcript_5634:400-1557(+)